MEVTSKNINHHILRLTRNEINLSIAKILIRDAYLKTRRTNYKMCKKLEQKETNKINKLINNFKTL